MAMVMRSMMVGTNPTTPDNLSEACVVSLSVAETDRHLSETMSNWGWANSGFAMR